MPYSKLLMKIVAESGYTAKSVIEECNKRGRKIDKAYMSKLLNNKVPPPSEEVSRMISNICDVDERLLVLEGYIDKAPKEIMEAFVSIKMITTFATLNVFKNTIDKQTMETLKEEMNKEPISNFIISLIDNKEANMNIDNDIFELSSKDENITVTLTEPIALAIKDNSMFPIVPEGSKISLKIETKYQNGDILAIKAKGQEDFIVRYALFNNGTIVLTALNKDFKPITYFMNDIIILGKVVRVIHDI